MLVQIGQHFCKRLHRETADVPRLWIILGLVVGSWLIVCVIVLATYHLAF
jgi:hypothetical protein